MNTRNTKFAQNFSDILRLKNISQSQFARLYGVKPNTVSQWANGKREPTYHDLMCICTLLDVEVKELLGYTPRTRNTILRDIIGGHDIYQKEQKDLQDRLFKEGKSIIEVQEACNELYKTRYEEYKKIFGFED